MICAKSFVTRHPSLVTFFGMIPNFEPQEILPKLASLVRPKDLLLFSANLAPGANYAAGVEKILPQYDNSLMRDWLMTFLFDLGVGKTDGELRFAIEDGGFDLRRVVARFCFSRTWQIEVDGENFKFRRGDSIQLFFSYRYTPEKVCKILAKFGLEIYGQWIARSQRRAFFFATRNNAFRKDCEDAMNEFIRVFAVLSHDIVAF